MKNYKKFLNWFLPAKIEWPFCAECDMIRQVGEKLAVSPARFSAMRAGTAVTEGPQPTAIY